MSFQDFAQRYIDDEDPFEDDPQLDRLMALQEVEPRVTPRHPDWIATVYFDPDKFPIEATLERIQRHYAETAPKRRYNLEMLSSERLMRSSIVKYPLAEEVFRRRGFVSDSEVIGFRRGDNSTETTYLAHNRATVHFQLALIDAYLGPPNTSAAGKERRKIALSQHIGQQGKAPVPLIERDGVFLPCQEFSQKEYVHLAYSAAVSPSLKNGRKDYYGLCYASRDELEAQIAFERGNSHALFDGASDSALLLWQLQALALLRKAAWQIEFFEGAALNVQQNKEEVRRSEAWKMLRGDESLMSAGGIQNAVQTAFNDHCDAFRDSVLNAIDESSIEDCYGKKFGLAEYYYGLTTEQNVVATLHGSTYCPDFDPEDFAVRSDPIYPLHDLAEWICDLKRRRYGVLNKRIASLLIAVFGEDNDEDFNNPQLSRFAPMIQDRFGEPAWTVIIAAVLELDGARNPEAIPVIYDWTRNADEPWLAERRADGVIAIRGPLLDFPVSQAAVWNAKSRVMFEEREIAYHWG